MTLNDMIANYLFNKAPELLADGVTAETARVKLTGLETELSGLSEKERTAIIEGSKALQSVVDSRLSEGIKTREKALKSESEAEKRKTDEIIKSLKGKIPMSADPAELRKQAETETDETKKTLLMLKADNIENKQTLDEQKRLNVEKDAALNKERQINLAKSALGKRVLPKSIKIESFLGATDEETTANMTAFNSEWDDFTKDMKTASVTNDTPPSGDQDESTGEEAMNTKLDNMSFLD